MPWEPVNFIGIVISSHEAISVFSWYFTMFRLYIGSVWMHGAEWLSHPFDRIRPTRKLNEKRIMKLCMSTYLTLLNLCRVPGASKASIGRKVLSCLNCEGDEAFYSDSTVSDLSRGKKNLGDLEMSFALDCDRGELSARLAERVLPLLDENKAPGMVAALQRIVAADPSILPTTEVDLVSHLNKGQFVAAGELVLSDVMAGTLVYCAAKVANRGTGDEAGEVTPQLLDEVFDASRKLLLRRCPVSRVSEETIWRKGPNSVTVAEADIFEFCGETARSIVVIPVDASFSTRVTKELGGDNVGGISENTLHGKWLERCSQSGISLDTRIAASLGRSPLGNEDGVGDIAVLDDGCTTYFLLAISVIKDGVAGSNEHLIRRAITSLFAKYDKVGQGYPMYIPLIGSGRSRVCLGHEESLQLILQAALENERHLQGKVVVVVPPGALASIDVEKVGKSCVL